MYRCMSPGAIGIPLAWRDCLPLAKAAGFEGVDLSIEPGTPASFYDEALAEHGLRPGGVGLPVNFREGVETFEKGIADLSDAASVASEAGATRFYTWIIPCSDDLPWKENFKLHAERLGRAARVLADAGCALGLEFLGPRTMREGHRYRFVRTLGQMLDLCEAVGPNAGLLLDSWHWYTSLGTCEDILELRPEQVVYVHINDAPSGVAIDRQKDSVRRLSGETGVIDLPGFLGALRTIGYDGPVTPEPFAAELAALPPEEAARRAGEALLKVWSTPPRPKLPKTMKTVALGGRKAWLVDLPVPVPQGCEVVVKIHASPICGSNMGAFYADGEFVNVGHEAAGEVVAVARSNLVKVGDRVVLAPQNACGTCPDCLRGDLIFCSRRPQVHGYFAQFTRVADVTCTVVPEDIDYERASLMGCCLGPPYEALKRIGLRAPDTVVISGLGPVGLGATALAAFMGSRVIGLDPEPFRRELALKLGAEAALDAASPEVRQALRDAVGGRGILKAVDCSGKEASQRLLIELAGTRAAVAFVGENPGTIPVSPSDDFIRKGLTVVGCWHMNQRDAPDLFEFLRRASGKAALLVTHRFGFGRAQEAFDVFASHRCAKVLLLPWE